jgi:hypothetical protein
MDIPELLELVGGYRIKSALTVLLWYEDIDKMGCCVLNVVITFLNGWNSDPTLVPTVNHSTKTGEPTQQVPNAPKTSV